MSGQRGRVVYRTPLWARVRREVLERDGWTCQSCGGPGTEAHHRVKLQDGGEAYDLANLETLCRGCHLARHLPPVTRAWRRLFVNALGRA